MKPLTHVSAVHLENGTGWWVFGFVGKSQPFAFNTVTEDRAKEGARILKTKLAAGSVTPGQASMALRKHFAAKLNERRRK